MSLCAGVHALLQRLRPRPHSESGGDSGRGSGGDTHYTAPHTACAHEEGCVPAGHGASRGLQGAYHLHVYTDALVRRCVKPSLPYSAYHRRSLSFAPLHPLRTTPLCSRLGGAVTLPLYEGPLPCEV